MKKQFYSQIIEIDSLYLELDNLTLSEKEKDHLKNIIDTSLFHKIIDEVLQVLPDNDKRIFLEKVDKENHDITMDFLQKRILNIEYKIKRIAKDLLQEMKEDIKEIKG